MRIMKGATVRSQAPGSRKHAPRRVAYGNFAFARLLHLRDFTRIEAPYPIDPACRATLVPGLPASPHSMTDVTFRTAVENRNFGKNGAIQAN
jgi:hypothetical protein